MYYIPLSSPLRTPVLWPTIYERPSCLNFCSPGSNWHLNHPPPPPLPLPYLSDAAVDEPVPLVPYQRVPLPHQLGGPQLRPILLTGLYRGPFGVSIEWRICWSQCNFPPKNWNFKLLWNVFNSQELIVRNNEILYFEWIFKWRKHIRIFVWL